jgi:mRNA interferase MazF
MIGYHRDTPDMVVVAMTSNPVQTPYSFLITTADLASGALNHPGSVRADKVYTLAQTLAIKSFGKVNNLTLDRIRRILGDICR